MSSLKKREKYLHVLLNPKERMSVEEESSKLGISQSVVVRILIRIKIGAQKAGSNQASGTAATSNRTRHSAMTNVV